MTQLDLLEIVQGARRLRPNTKRAYANVVRQWLLFAGGAPAHWTVAVGQAFYDHLIAGGVTIATANSMITGGLAFAFERAAALHGVPNIVAGIDRAKSGLGDDGPVVQRAMTSPQAKALLAACVGKRLQDRRDYAVTLIGLYTGMRRMSLVDIDLGRVADHGAFVTLSVLLKGGKRYDVPLDSRAWALTAEYRAGLQTAKTTSPGLTSAYLKGGGPFAPAFTAPRLVPGQLATAVTIAGTISEDGLYKSLQKRAETAGLTKFHPHLFRHTFATWCRSAKVEDYLIEVVTGHASNRGLVDRVYTDRLEMAADVARRCYEAVTDRLT